MKKTQSSQNLCDQKITKFSKFMRYKITKYQKLPSKITGKSHKALTIHVKKTQSCQNSCDQKSQSKQVAEKSPCENCTKITKYV